jgi:hypothetical protein
MEPNDEPPTSDTWLLLGLQAEYIAVDMALWRASRSFTEPDDVTVAKLVCDRSRRYMRTRRYSDAIAVLAAALALMGAAGPVPVAPAADHES